MGASQSISKKSNVPDEQRAELLRLAHARSQLSQSIMKVRLSGMLMISDAIEQLVEEGYESAGGAVCKLTKTECAVGKKLLIELNECIKKTVRMEETEKLREDVTGRAQAFMNSFFLPHCDDSLLIAI